MLTTGEEQQDVQREWVPAMRRPGLPSNNLHFILLMQNGIRRPGLPITPEINHVLPNWTLSFHSDNADGRQIVWYGLVHISSK